MSYDTSGLILYINKTVEIIVVVGDVGGIGIGQKKLKSCTGYLRKSLWCKGLGARETSPFILWSRREFGPLADKLW